ncbi:MAG: hypothetical protein Q7S66_02560 [bacterium]|nr:hypothetical protein [bacterium]
MTLRQYLILMSTGTVSCWLAWILIVWSISPDSMGWLGILFFYASLFLALVGTFSVVGFLIRRKILKNDDLVFRKVKKTFRQGVLSASLVIIVLMLLHLDFLTWWLAVLIALFYAILEGIIFSHYKIEENRYV